MISKKSSIVLEPSNVLVAHTIISSKNMMI